MPLLAVALGAALAAAPGPVVLELAPEAGNSASGQSIADYDRRLARAVVSDLDAHGIAASISDAGEPVQGARLTLRLNHHAIPALWIQAGHAKAFFGFAVGLTATNPDMATTVTCARLLGTAMRQAGELPSLYRSLKMPGLDHPLVDEALGIHQLKGPNPLAGRAGAALTLEVGIVSHPDDTLRLANPVVVSGLADAIASGIDACLNPVPEEDEDVPDQAQDASA